MYPNRRGGEHLIKLHEFEIGGAIMLLGFLLTPWLVSSHWPKATASERRRWLMIYRATYLLAFLGLVAGWLVPGVGGTAFIGACVLGLCAMVYTFVRTV